MKKIFSAIISSPLKGRLGGVLFALLATTTLWAYDFQSGDLYYNITSSSAPYTVEVTSKTSSYPYNDGVTFTTITIPKTVSYGGITYSVTSIGDYAFNSCESLTSITIPNSVTSIGESAFSYCSSLTSVTPDNSVTSIGSSAFYGCSSLTSITIPNGVTSIGGKAFYECSSLTSITIPNSVTSIGACTFESCSSLSSITIPNSVTSIGDRAFRKCSSLTSITIPNSVTSVGGAVFHSCSALKSVVLSENITSLETITISSGKGFGWYGFFEDCSSLTSITIPKNMEFMDDDTFDDCSSLKSIVWNAKNCKSSIFDDSYVSSQITSFVIGKDVEHIPAGLCQGMKLIPSITIPSGVKNIGNRAFYGCSSLVTMVVESDNIVYDSRNHCNAIVETATNKLIAGCQNTIIPNSVTSIGSSAFEHCSSLTSITIPNSVTSIGEYAFSSCYSLTSVTLPNSVSSIGYSAFEDCSSLTSITIPNSVTSIGDRAFRKCSSLTSITIPNGVTSIGASTFESCSSLSSITIPNSVTSIGSSAFYGCSSLTSVTIPNGVTSIGNRAFYDCSSLTSVTLGNSVTSIGEDAFYDCSSLTSVTLGNSVTSIGEYAFSYCSSLTSMTIPNSVTSIGRSAFYACESLISVFLEPNTPPTLGKNNFTASTICYIPCGTLSAYESSTWEEIVGRFVEQCGDSSTLNKCGNDLYWEYRNSTLAITGTGDMYDYTVDSSAPWHNFSEQIKCITIGNCVTSIGNYAFCDCSSLDSISVYAITPPKFGNSGNLLTSSPTCYIPCGTLAAYQSSSWAEQVGSFVEQCNEPVKCGDNLYWTYANGTLTITGTGTMYNYDDMDNLAPWNSIRNNIKNIVLPEGLTSIGDWAFYLCSYVTSISIPEEVTNIGDRAFQYCNSLTSVIWNAENCDDYWVTESSRPFYDCSQITSFTFGDSVKHIPAYLCYDMSSLTSIIIPNRVTSIGDCAFQYCNSLTSVIWNAENCDDYWVTESSRPFYDCSQITSFTFGDSVKHIPAYLCYDMSSLTSIIIPNSVTNIGYKAFSHCSSLTSVIWNAENCDDYWGAESYRPFYDCSQITSFTFGDSVKHIPAHLCYEMSSLTSVNMGNSVTSIGYKAFSHCSSLSSITIPNSITNIGEKAFLGCSDLASVIWNAENCDDFSWSEIRPFYDCFQITSFTFGDSVKHIPTYLCYEMSTLTSISIPNSVTSIGGGAFYNCSSLDSVVVEAITPPTLGDAGNYSFFSSPTCYIPCGTLAAYQSSSWAEQVGSFVEQCDEPVVDANKCGDNLYWAYTDGTLTITGTGDMYNYDYMDNLAPWNSVSNNIKNIVLPEGLTSIGEWAFYLCASVTSISIPEGVSSIGVRAFCNCSSLTSISIPNSVTSIGERAFYSCYNLASVTLSTNLSKIDKYLFGQCRALAAITIPNNVTAIENGAFSGCSSLDSVSIEATTPPVLSGSSTFSSSPTCYIPCGTLAAYQSSSWAEQVGGFVEQCDDNDNNQSLISVTDGALSDWDKLPMEYLFETKCVEGASWDALKSVKVYADLTYINLVVEWDTDIVTDLSSVPFHVYLNVDNDAPTGGFGEQWVKPNIDLLLEGYFYLDGNPCAYQPDVALYAGTPLANEWAWDWTTIEALAASQLITKGVMEIQIEYGKLPVKLENTFTVGFDIQQSWNSVGVLPNAADDEVGNMILAEKMLVRINNVNAPTSIENTHSPSSITNTHKLLRNGQLIILHDGKTYTVMGAEIK